MKPERLLEAVEELIAWEMESVNTAHNQCRIDTLLFYKENLSNRIYLQDLGKKNQAIQQAEKLVELLKEV